MLSRKSLKQKLLRDSSKALPVKICGAGLAYGVFVAFARWMSVDDYGAFMILFSVALFGGVVTSGGSVNLVMRFVSEYRAKGELRLQAGVIRFCYYTMSIVGALAILVFSIWGLLTHGNLLLWVVVGLMAPVFALSQFQSALLRSYDSVWRAIVPFDIGWRVLMLASGWAWFQYAGHISPATGIVITFLTLLAVVLVQGVAVLSVVPNAIGQCVPEYDLRAWIKSGRYVWGASVWSRSFQHVSVILAGMTLSLADAAIFSVVMKTTRLLMVPLEAAAVLGQPLIGREINKDISSTQDICNWLSGAVGIVCLGALLFMIVFGHAVLGVFGAEYQAGYLALLVLSAAVLVNALTGPTAFIMISAGAEGLYLAFLTASSVIGLLVQIGGGIWWGLEGAVIGVGIAQVGWNLLVWWWARRRIGIDPTIFGIIFRPRAQGDLIPFVRASD